MSNKIHPLEETPLERFEREGKELREETKRIIGDGPPYPDRSAECRAAWETVAAKDARIRQLEEERKAWIRSFPNPKLDEL
jgi:hypothetical protein